MRFSLKAASAGSTLTIMLLLLAPVASAGPKEYVATAAATWARALGEDDPDKVLPLYSDDAVLWGTLSPTVRADRAALRDYFVTAFKALPGLKVAFGDQLHVFLCQGWRDQELACALQLHLRQERRELAHCRPSFLGHATGPKIALRVSGFESIMRTKADVRQDAAIKGCTGKKLPLNQCGQADEVKLASVFHRDENETSGDVPRSP
jgi:hypothetical protein